MAVLFEKEAKAYVDSELVKKSLREIYQNKIKENSKKPETEIGDLLGIDDVEGLKTWSGSSSTSLFYRNSKQKNPICAFGFIDAQANPSLSQRMNVARLPSLQLVRKEASFISPIDDLKEEEISFLIERSAKGIISVVATKYQWDAFIKSKPVSVLAILKDLNSREYDLFERSAQDFSFRYDMHFGVTTETEILEHYGLEFPTSDPQDRIFNNPRFADGPPQVMGPNVGPVPDVMGSNDIIIMLHLGPHSKPLYFQGNFTCSSVGLWIQKWAEISVPEVDGDNWGKWAMSKTPLFLLIDEFKDAKEIDQYIDILYQLTAEFSSHLRFGYSNLAKTPHVVDFYRFSGETSPVITISQHTQNKHFNYPENQPLTFNALREWILTWLDGGVEGKEIQLPENVKENYKPKYKVRRVA